MTSARRRAARILSSIPRGGLYKSFDIRSPPSRASCGNLDRLRKPASLHALPPGRAADWIQRKDLRQPQQCGLGSRSGKRSSLWNLHTRSTSVQVGACGRCLVSPTRFPDSLIAMIKSELVAGPYPAPSFSPSKSETQSVVHRKVRGVCDTHLGRLLVLESTTAANWTSGFFFRA